MIARSSCSKQQVLHNSSNLDGAKKTKRFRTQLMPTCASRRYSQIKAHFDLVAAASLHLLWRLVGCSVLGAQHSGVCVQRYERGAARGKCCTAVLKSPDTTPRSAVAAATTVGLTLPYPQHKYAAEFAIQWLFLLVEPCRLFLGVWGAALCMSSDDGLQHTCSRAADCTGTCHGQTHLSHALPAHVQPDRCSARKHIVLLLLLL